jgi:uncharacterized protein YjbI with pentapeptide repeats
MNMSRAPNRDSRAPRLALNLERPDVAGDVFADEAVHEGLRLEGSQLADIEAEKVELKQFLLAEVALSGARLDRLDLEDGWIKACDLANLRSQTCSLERVVIEASRLTGAVLVEPRLTDVVFREAPLELASFRFGRFNRVRFERCRLVEADFQGVAAKACTFVECDLAGAQFSQANFAGSAFRGCQLQAVRGLEALKGAHMAWEDVLELATALAASLGIEIRDDIS